MYRLENFGRYCVLEVYNESTNQLSTYRGYANKTDDNFDGTRIKFNVQKTKEKNNLPYANIKIYNTADLKNKSTTSSKMLKKNNFVRLYACYSDVEFSNNLKPIFEGEIIVVRNVYDNPDNYVVLECYGGLQTRAKRLPSVSLKGQVSVDKLLSTLQGKIDNIGFSLNKNSLAKIDSSIMNNVISNRGFSLNATENVSGFLDNFTSSISTKDKKISWYFDDLQKQIMFANLKDTKEPLATSGILILERGVNSKLIDNSSIERMNKELYYQKATNTQKTLTPQQKKQASLGRSTVGYKNSVIIQSPIIPNVNLNTKWKIKGFDEVPKGISLNTLRWQGDTHGLKDDWKIEYIFTYERNGTN